MKVLPINNLQDPIAKQSPKRSLPNNVSKKLRTGRGCFLDCLCSIKTFIIIFLIGSLFLSCAVILITMMILLSQEVNITMGIVSLVVCCTFIVTVCVFSVLASVGVYYLIRRPLEEFTRQLLTMKSLRFDSVKEPGSILYEFIPAFSVFTDLNNLMKDIKPFIPESITGLKEEEDSEYNNKEQQDEIKEIQMMTFRKSQVASGSVSQFNAQLVMGSSVASINTNHQAVCNSLKSENSVAKLKKVMSKVRKSIDGNGSDVGASFMSKDSGAGISHTGFKPQPTTNLGLGLTSHISTIIIIQFRNFDGKSYPNTQDLVSVFTLLFQKVQSASRQFKARCSIITPKVLMVSFETGKNVERNALLCALQLEKQMQAINAQLCEQVNLPPIQFGIGVSRSECLVGNIGTAAVKYSALIGSCSSNALKLASLCAQFGISILTDESLALALQRGFITRSVHFMKKTSILEGEISLSLEDSEQDTRQVIFQLLGESKVNDDEWFYEIQQQENNNKFKEYDRAFDLLRVGDVDIKLLGEICDVLGSYLSKYPEDRVVLLLYTQLTELSKLDAKDIVGAIRSFCLENTNVPLHTDPSSIL